MALFRRCSSAPSGYCFSWTAVLALYLIVTIKPAKPMAGNTKVCHGFYAYANNHVTFMRRVEAMRNCTVLEGGLHLSFLDMRRYPEIRQIYKNALFPNLREISGFLLLHNTNGFETLHELFPNLSVIRGEPPLTDKDFNPSLSITDNNNLERIGLNLAVLNGSVHIIGNKLLCLGKELEMLKKNSPNVKIYMRGNVEDSLDNTTNARLCQGQSFSSWPSPESTTCHDLCLGGCTGPSASECYVCRNFQYNNTCVLECPPNESFNLPSHRCTDAVGCVERGSLNIFRKEFLGAAKKNAEYLVRNNSCVLGCTEPYKLKFECGLMYCKLPCSRERVTSVFDLQEYQNCTQTDMPLEIVIPAPISDCEKLNVSEWDSALEKNLGSIKTITGGLRITRLHGVRNLHFLKSLETIIVTNRTNVTILIDDNALLNELFTETVTSRLKIQHEKGYFVNITNNPMLCTKEILHLNNASLSGGTLFYILNGIKAQCNDSMPSLKPDVKHRNANSAKIEWTPPKVDFNAVYFTLFFRPAPSQGNHFSAPILATNFPSSEAWESQEVFKNNTDHFDLIKLTANTRYAVYIQAVYREDNSNKTKVYRSKISYFSTRGVISPPCTVSAWPYPTTLSSESALKIEWAARKQYESQFEYLITGKYIEETGSPCSSMHFRQLNIVPDYVTTLKRIKRCESPVSDRRQIVEPCDPIDFSSFLDGFIETMPYTPPDVFPLGSKPVAPVPVLKLTVENETDTGNSTGRLKFFSVVSPTESVVVKNLIPFRNYQISVHTCRIAKGEYQNESLEERCSKPAVAISRSSAVENADTFVLPPIVIPSGRSSFVLQWEKGKVTNSLAWFTVKITDGNNVQESLCSEGNEIRFENKTDGVYNICVTVESMFKSGQTECISYSVSATHPWESILMVLFGVIGVVIAISFVIRRVQQFKSDDRLVLLSEESFDTNVQFSEIPVNDLEDALS